MTGAPLGPGGPGFKRFTGFKGFRGEGIALRAMSIYAAGAAVVGILMDTPFGREGSKGSKGSKV